MTNPEGAWPPPWPLIGAAILVAAEGLVPVGSDVPVGLVAFQLLISFLLGLFLLRGSRIAWVLTFLGSFMQLIRWLGDGQSDGTAIATFILIVGLLVPPSLRYVWVSPPQPLTARTIPFPKTLFERIRSFSYLAMARVAGWENDIRAGELSASQRSYGSLLWRLGTALVVLFLAGGVIHVWQEGSGHDSLIADILERITWTVLIVGQLAFVGLLAVAAYGYLMRKLRMFSPKRRRDS